MITTNRIPLLLCLVFYGINLLGQTSSTPSGAGTSISPYLISSLDELYWIQDENKTASSIYIELANDIDASATSTWTNGWEPIGGTFQGSFDGKGYTISNLLIRNTYVSATSGRTLAGLFAATSGATIKNLTLEVTLDLIPNGQSSSHPYILNYGALIGSAASTNITDVRITGEMINIDPATVDYSNMNNIGGFAGSISNSTFLRCSFEGTLIGSGSVGGLGSGDNNTVDECYVDGTIYAEYYNLLGSNGYCYTGMIGRNTGSSGYFSNCYAKGTIYGYNNISGLGYVHQSSLTNCYSAVDIVLRQKTGASTFNYSPSTSFCYLFSWKQGIWVTITDCISDQTLDKVGITSYNYVYETAATTWAPYNAKNFSSSIWGWHADINGGYPYLKNLETYITTDLTNSGTETLPGSTSVSVLPGVTVDVATLDLNGSSFNLLANATDYSQLKFGSISGAGSVTQSQYLTNDGYASISSPMTTDFATTSGDNTKMFYYDGSAFAWRTSDQAGRGYFASIGASVFATSAGTFSVTGTPNTSMTHSLSYSVNAAANGSGTGWNLVGNPYTCGLDWTAMTKTDVNDAFYVWDPATSLYKYYASGAISGTYLTASNTLTAIIPPMQAFWVQTTSNSAALSSTMADDGTLLSAPTYISKTVPDNLILGVVALNDSSVNDAMWLIDNMQAKTGFDGSYDAWKMDNGDNQPNISSVFNGEEMAINALDFVNTPVIPVSFDGPTKGTYAFSLEQIVNGASYKVTLEDKHLNLFYDISSKDYTFKNIGWDSEDSRFLLHLESLQLLSDNNDADDQDIHSDYYVYQSEDFIYLNQSEFGLFNTYTLYSIDGRRMTSGSVSNKLQPIHAPYPTGIYVLLLDSETSSVKVKINLLK